MRNPEIEFDFFDGIVNIEMRDAYIWIDTESKLQDLADILSKEEVFGVDTEQHSLRSFLGFTALVQISTREEDYLLDTIALHDVMGVLGPVFANPGICKVFHGADNDVLWLQRDFHLYVVNLFDTAKACDVLSKPQRSLAYLLETYCGVTTNKLLQREDWRQRPLSEEMVQYARMDAHYLLYIADCLVSELKQLENENSACLDDKLHFVLEARRRSDAVCLQLFAKEIEAYPGESAASTIIARHFNNQESASDFSSGAKFQELVRRVCTWRDLMARVHDESLRYVLSDNAVAALSETAPSNESDIYDVISQADLNVDSTNPYSSLRGPSSVVCSHFEDFSDLFRFEVGEPVDIFQLILEKHLGPNGSCPLSLHNYALLSRRNLEVANRFVSNEKKIKLNRKVARKTSRALFVQKFSCKAPVYHNCRIYANDGRLLCYCDRKKLDWYLRRDLAKVVEEDPPAIMLLFEPKGRPEDEDNDFYIQSKKNICVGCGEGSHYLRYRIIPSCYRIHFPEHLKSHRSHDIVLVCVDCHEIAHCAAEKYKRQIAADYRIPLFIRKVVDSCQARDISGSSSSVANLGDAGVSPLELRSSAMALLRHGPRMPSERREELLQIVRKYYGGREISDEDLERALLVGMSPHERKRLGKRKGLSLKSFSTLVSDNELENGGGSEPSSTSGDALNIDEENESQGSKDEPTGEDNHLTVKDDSNSVEAVSTTRNSKLSLLGHGPHGKQVVDYLLKEYGEDGILEFCQKWRKVFVDAIQPRFLPAGWDVTHSGRREFGEFSVHNPSRKAPATAKV